MPPATELNMLASRTVFLKPEQERPNWLNLIAPRVNALHVGHLSAGFHSHDRIAFDHELTIILSGTMRLTMGSQPLVCHGGDVFISPPGIVHTFDVLSGPLQRVSIHFDWDRQHPIGQLMPYQHLMHGPIDPSRIKPTPSWVELPLPLVVNRPGEKAWRLGLEIAAEIDLARDPGRTGRLNGRVLTLLIELATGRSDRSTPRTSPVERIKSLIDRNYAGEVHLAEIAEKLGITPSQMSRSFKRHFGLTPNAYLLELRLMDAMRRLRAGGADIAAIARTTGFNDPNYFSRMFARRWGIAPSRVASGRSLTA